MSHSLFAGTRGITNTLIGLFGTEAVFEFRNERIWHADDDTAQEDDARQILPVLVCSETRALSGTVSAESHAELTLLLAAANLRRPIEPGITRVLFRRRVWLVRSAVAHYDGGRVHAWELSVSEI